MTTRNLSQVFGRTDRAGGVHVLDEEGHPVTRLVGVTDFRPVGSDRCADYEHPLGIVLSRHDAEHLMIDLDGAIEEHEEHLDHYVVEQTATGAELYAGLAASEADALDRMAVAAGYASYAAIPAEIGGGDTVRARRV